jgi:hypothetical protein
MVSDITYIRTDEGWLYAAAVLDLYGQKVIGLSMGGRMTKELVLKALDEAYMRSGRPKGALIHSDRGSQYCSHESRSQRLEIRDAGTAPVPSERTIHLVSLLVVRWLHHLSKAGWSFSNMATMLQLNLFTYRALRAWLDEPYETPLIVPEAEQLKFSL